MQARIIMMPIPLVILEETKEQDCDTIKVNMSQKTAPARSKTYKSKMTIIEDGKPKELFYFLNNFKKSINGAVTTYS